MAETDGYQDPYAECPRCGGSGTVSHGPFSWSDCPKCNGNGFIHKRNLP